MPTYAAPLIGMVLLVFWGVVLAGTSPSHGLLAMAVSSWSVAGAFCVRQAVKGTGGQSAFSAVVALLLFTLTGYMAWVWTILLPRMR